MVSTTKGKIFKFFYYLIFLTISCTSFADPGELTIIVEPHFSPNGPADALMVSLKNVHHILEKEDCVFNSRLDILINEDIITHKNRGKIFAKIDCSDPTLEIKVSTKLPLTIFTYPYGVIEVINSISSRAYEFNGYDFKSDN